jgi:hypothetical protein
MVKMLDHEEQITFIPELIEIIDAFLKEYEQRKGTLRNDLERGLVISYVLGILHCDLEAVWDGLSQAHVFGDLHPRVVFEECVGDDLQVSQERQRLILEELHRRGWIEQEAGSHS